MDKIRVSAKTKEEAITKAAIQLSTTSDRLGYNVLVQGSNGLFGIGAKPWILEAFVKEESVQTEQSAEEIVEARPTADEKSETASEITAVAEEKTEEAEKLAEVVTESTAKAVPEQPAAREEKKSFRGRRDENRAPRKRNERFDRENRKHSRGGYEEVPQPEKKHEIKPVSPEEAEAATEKAMSFISSVLTGMGMEVSTESSFDHASNELQINLTGPDMGLLIGKRGQTLDSLQYLTSLVVNREHKEEYIRIKLDTEDYRKRREQTLRNLARNIAYKVKRNRKPVSLEPMNPYERRIIHAALQGDRYVTTKSEGEEPFRHIIIYLKRDRENRSEK